jgi:hypothetical protein
MDRRVKPGDDDKGGRDRKIVFGRIRCGLDSASHAYHVHRQRELPVGPHGGETEISTERSQFLADFSRKIGSALTRESQSSAAGAGMPDAYSLSTGKANVTPKKAKKCQKMPKRSCRKPNPKPLKRAREAAPRAIATYRNAPYVPRTP